MKMIKNMISRCRQVWRYRTIRNIVVYPGDENSLLVFHQGKEAKIPRYCPHQKADLLQGRLEDGDVICPWHGHKIKTKICIEDRPSDE